MRDDTSIPSQLRDDMVLSVRQVAQLDGTSDDTVRREIARGRLKATRLSERRLGVRVVDYRAARAS